MKCVASPPARLFLPVRFFRPAPSASLARYITDSRNSKSSISGNPEWQEHLADLVREKQLRRFLRKEVALRPQSRGRAEACEKAWGFIR
jgi:hypothetical protein